MVVSTSLKQLLGLMTTIEIVLYFISMEKAKKQKTKNKNNKNKKNQCPVKEEDLFHMEAQEWYLLCDHLSHLRECIISSYTRKPQGFWSIGRSYVVRATPVRLLLGTGWTRLSWDALKLGSVWEKLETSESFVRLVFNYGSVQTFQNLKNWTLKHTGLKRFRKDSQPLLKWVKCSLWGKAGCLHSDGETAVFQYICAVRVWILSEKEASRHVGMKD